jgi:hypothetical protein
MRRHVLVSFGEDNEFDFQFGPADLAGKDAGEARQWFEREFAALECDVATPIGKVLLADFILSVAKYAGERRFREQHLWAEQFAKNAAVLLARELIRVDVLNNVVGY